MLAQIGIDCRQAPHFYFGTNDACYAFLKDLFDTHPLPIVPLLKCDIYLNCTFKCRQTV